MTLIFYPNSDDMQKGSLEEKIELLMESADRYKAVVLDVGTTDTRTVLPRELSAAYNWEEIAKVLKEIRECPEINKLDKMKKSDHLAKLAEVYEVLRAAKMSKLEAVRLALINEANQLKNSAAQVS